MRTATALLAALLVSGMSGAALAQSKGFYVGGALGYTSLRDADVRGSGINRTDSYESALSGAGTLGFAHGNGIRTEIELSRRENDVDRVTGTGAGTGAGAIAATSGMLNLIYDLRAGASLTPYIGIGAGLAYFSGDGARSTAAGTGSIKGSDTEFAYQAIAGIAFAVTERVSLALDYRYLSTFQEPDLDLRFASGASRSVSVDYASHSFMLGLRYQFAAPSVPAAAAPAPAPQPAPAAAPAPAPLRRARRRPTSSGRSWCSSTSTGRISPRRPNASSRRPPITPSAAASRASSSPDMRTRPAPRRTTSASRNDGPQRSATLCSATACRPP